MRRVSSPARRAAPPPGPAPRAPGWAAAALLLAGCVAEDAPADDLGVVAQAGTVADHVDTACSTSVVLALSRQIAEEVDCMLPGQLVSFADVPGVVMTGAAVLPYVSTEARDDLEAAAVAGDVEINSAFRSVAQQYLLRAWFEAGRCGITAAALPGESNHESGRAIDVNNWPDRLGALEANGWLQTVPGDEVHFDHVASPDLRGADVLAFQRLWNRNHPEEVIDEDGSWGPMTEDALLRSPDTGFALGADCSDLEDPDDGGGELAPPDDAGGGGLFGGCAAGGGAGGGGLALALLALRPRRRAVRR